MTRSYTRVLPAPNAPLEATDAPKALWCSHEAALAAAARLRGTLPVGNRAQPDRVVHRVDRSILLALKEIALEEELAV